MKKCLIVLMVFVLVTLSGCTLTKKQDDNNGAGTNTTNSGEKNGTINFDGDKKFDEDKVISQLSVTGYRYKTEYWNYAFIIIKNNSKENICISIQVKFYDKDGNLIGASDDTADAVQSGTETIFDFTPDESFDSFDYELSVEREEYYECASADLSFVSTSAKEKEIVTVTNNGKITATTVIGYMLFFRDDKIVGAEYRYFENSDGELAPGESTTKEMTCYRDYDSYKFVVYGYSNK